MPHPRFKISKNDTGEYTFNLSHGPAHPLVELRLPSGEAHEFPANGWISYAKGNSVQVVLTGFDRRYGPSTRP